MSKNRKRKQREIEKDDKSLICDRANRRDVRLGTIIGIVAILVTFCSVLFRCAKSAIAVWPESGYIYYILMWSVFLIPLSATLLICFDIILFVIADLNRYNLKDDDYQKYDTESDLRYSSMINDFKIMLGVFFVLIFFIAIINGFLQRNPQGVMVIVFCFLLIALGGMILIRKIVRKEVEWIRIWNVIQRLLILIMVLLIVWVITITLVSRNSAKVDVLFDEKGNIIIENAIDEEFGTVSLSIFDEEGSLVDNINISEKDVLQAKESTGQRVKNDNGDEIGKAQRISGEMLYWKYQYKINELEIPDGKYWVQIDILQEQRTLRIINMFEVENTMYSFGKDNIHKEY